MRVVFGVISALALGAAVPSCASAQAPDERVVEDTAFLRAMFRVAFREGLYTAHSADTPQLVCVGVNPTTNSGGGWSAEVIDPPLSVIADLQRGRSILIRPRSACRLMPIGSSAPRTSLVQDTLTGKRGILVWVQAPEKLANGTLSVGLGYHQHELSAGWWTCAVRRTEKGWEVLQCRLVGIS